MSTLDLKNNPNHLRICSIKQLEKYLPLTKKEKTAMEQVISCHPFLVSKYYLSLIDKKDKKDPIRKMIIPSADELVETGKFDTSGEAENTKIPGLQHKYSQTVLILSTNTCAAYCRYCFRKRLVGLSSEETLKLFDEAISYIRLHKEINNVLITGGDSFMLPTSVIENFLRVLTKIPHIDFIRFGTRTPVTYPHRITGSKHLLEILKHYNKRKTIYVVTHFNHPREITRESKKALSMLSDAGINVFNQTVLLRDVNDDSKLLSDLWTRLIKEKVMPYYFFQCRPVKRVKHHFQVPLYRGLKIFDEARNGVGGHIMCKRLKYIMSHRTGKIEVLGIEKNRIYFKYHHAKDPKNLNRFFSRKLDNKACWLDDLKK